MYYSCEMSVRVFISLSCFVFNCIIFHTCQHPLIFITHIYYEQSNNIFIQIDETPAGSNKFNAGVSAIVRVQLKDGTHHEGILNTK